MRLYIMQLGLGSSGSPVPGYLIQTDDGMNVLVDSGYPEDKYGDGGDYPADDWVVNRLAEIGLAPEDIDTVVCTHLDVDHAGSHDAFPNAEFVVQEEHLNAAREMPRFQSIRSHWDDPRLNYRTVSGDTELLPGVELIESSGHVPGHQAVLVRLPETGPVLLAIDAMPFDITGFTPETRPTGQYDNDPEGTRRSTRKLVDLSEREGVKLTVHGHDSGNWPGLKKSPDYYE
ncbi:MAG TPA: N-acyl homoserine lactonase family protein [Nitrolancea sp.]|jgi:N-acyl homoserine lactone hydrolase|nr:N-acyl homoserine lactonase family protein [Nitrolancea sp.]